MMHHRILTEPGSTRRILANLNLAIDEALLTRKISGLKDQLRLIENKPEQRVRTRYLKHEQSRLQSELLDIRQTASTYE